MPRFTLNDWFCLKQGRDNYRPRIPEDRELVLCHNATINDDILGTIEMQFATNDPVKLLVYGDWGVGKTHSIHHICWWLEKNHSDFPAQPVVIEIGDITKTTRFDAIVRPMLEEFGLIDLIQLAHEYQQAKPNFSASLQDRGIAAHIAEDYRKFTLSPPGQPLTEAQTLAFSHLCGRKVAGIGQLLDSKDFVDVLRALAEMYLTVHEERLVFVADEAAKLEPIEADEATMAHWINANKLIFDDANRSFGFVYTVSGKGLRSLPKTIWHSQLQNRLGDKAFELLTLSQQDVKSFIDQLVEKFTDRPRVEALVQSGDINPQEYRWEDYPFTAAAKLDFIDYFQRTQENAKPRDICKKLDDVAFIAGKSQKRLIDQACIQTANM